MAAYVIDPDVQPVLIGSDAVIYEPLPGETYYILKVDGVEQPELERFKLYEEANYVANAKMAGLDSVDKRSWEVVEKVKPLE